jgi:hypothetical protein
MTPSAMTAAGRATTSRSAPTGPAIRRAPAHRRHLRHRQAPALPRRVSGPAGTRARTAPAPRHHATLGTRALAVVRSLPEHSLVDRLVRGRAWIPVLGVLLAGIVAMQVEVLKLGNNVGRYVDRTTTLQSQNEALQASVAALNDDQRIESLAGAMGMVMPSPATIAFLHPSPGGDASRALTNIHPPDPTGFANQLAALAASAAATAPQSTSSQATASTGLGASGAAGASSASSGAATTTAPASSGASAGSGAATGSAASTGAGAATTTTPATSQPPPSGNGASTGAAQSPSTGAAAFAPSTSSQSSAPAGG